MSFTFSTTPTLRCGAGSIDDLETMALPLLGQRIVIVTDPGIVQIGLLARALTPLEKSGAEVMVFDSVMADPPQEAVLDAVHAARDFRISGVIGFGGGSAMDVAKLVALLVSGSQSIESAYGVGNALGPRLPLMLIPTTAGTGSEVTPISIVTTGEHEKKGIVSPLLIPDVAVLDATLTVGLPAHVSAATGVDAMVHAIEAYTSVNANNNLISQGLARESLRLLAANIERAVMHGDDLEARQNMLIGACLAGQAFANSPVGAVHALAYPLGVRYKLPHGLTNALMLEAVMRFNLPAAGAAYAELRAAAFPAHAINASSSEVSDLISDLKTLIHRLGLPSRLRDVGVPVDDIEALARDAMQQTRLLVNNPRPLDQQDIESIYRAAW